MLIERNARRTFRVASLPACAKRTPRLRVADPPLARSSPFRRRVAKSWGWRGQYLSDLLAEWAIALKRTPGCLGGCLLVRRGDPESLSWEFGLGGVTCTARGASPRAGRACAASSRARKLSSTISRNAAGSSRIIDAASEARCVVSPPKQARSIVFGVREIFANPGRFS